MDLIHLIYCSAASNPDLSLDEIDTIQKKSRANNAEVGITGMLLFDQGSFFQVIEGERAVVEALFEVICEDEHHTNVAKILLESIEARDFGDWTMGLSRLTRDDFAQISGLNDFFVAGRSFQDLGAGRARTLLAAYKDGRWRASLSR